MSKSTITISLVLVALTALGFTVLNKRWVGLRITGKWDVTTGGTSDDDPWTVYGPDWKKWTLPQLWEAWSKGKKGWYPKGQRPDLATTSEFDV